MRHSKNHSALKSLDKYAHAVKSILEREEEGADGEQRQLNHINWKAKANPMIREKYQPPQPTQFHDSTVGYLDDLRVKRKSDGVNPQVNIIDKIIKDPTIKEYDRLNVVRQHAHFLEERAKRDEKMLLHGGNTTGVDKEMEVNDMYLDAITAKLRLLDKI